MTRIVANDPPEALLELDDHRFRAIVDLDVKQKLEKEVAQKLRHPAVAARWRFALVSMKRTAEGVSQARRLECKAARRQLGLQASKCDDAASRELLRDEAERCLAEFEEWKTSNARFLTAVETKFAEANYHVRLHDGRATDRVAQLESAIRWHHAQIDPDDATDDDHALWATLRE